MAELPELERQLEQRITAALARIGAGVERLGAGPTPALTRLQMELDAERAARAAADDALNQMQMPIAGDHSAEVDRLTRALDAQGFDNQRLRSSVAGLREELRRMREALDQGMADAPLVNRAMQAELEALRAVRAAETTEMADILSALAPLVDAEEHAHA